MGKKEKTLNTHTHITSASGQDETERNWHKHMHTEVFSYIFTRDTSYNTGFEPVQYRTDTTVVHKQALVEEHSGSPTRVGSCTGDRATNGNPHSTGTQDHATLTERKHRTLVYETNKTPLKRETQPTWRRRRRTKWNPKESKKKRKLPNPRSNYIPS